MKRLVVALLSGAFLMGTVAPVEASTTMGGEVTISAASSLTDALSEVAKAFRVAYPKAKVRINFGSSATLVTQIQSGAPSDVIASADLASVEKLVASGHVLVAPRVFARNSMAIAVKPGNPKKVMSLNDLSRLDVIAMCGKSVPCGVYAASALSRAGVVIGESNITRGADAKATLGAVATGDADAALVYKTDVLAAKKNVALIEIKSAFNVKVKYGIATIRGSKNAVLAKTFVDFVLSEKGLKILKGYGFQKP